jgi:hypothetical protein
MGGLQRLYSGNIKTGEHALQVSYSGISTGGTAIEHADNFRVRKGAGPCFVEITLADQGITFGDR